ncbi:cathepsin l [Reticulomyxa filosa]|uniref:Cathepsin l n=1 Tax=Reticulomyxa filosa TaxID=46433 RepID=X6M2Z8_RETFI|nr:cathepsin l [Reticulomyxa filosa]|eukprot:ETO07842.1 cathepsin l [Reticulomyxa filosa]
MKTLLLLGTAFATSFGLTDLAWDTEFTKEQLNDLDARGVFEQWHKKFGRDYVSEAEEAHRFGIWSDNLWKIADYNSRGLGFKLRLNQFADLTGEEFRLQVHGRSGSCLRQEDKKKLKRARTTKQLSLIKNNWTFLTGSAKGRGERKVSFLKKRKFEFEMKFVVDWTEKGVVTPVKNQGNCGSCWAFSATGSMECDYAIKTGILTSLSEQQLVDCSGSFGNYGCSGGWYYYAWQYAEQAGGLCTETEYPYTGVDGTCNTNSCKTKYNLPSAFTDITAEDPSALEVAASEGCVSVAIEVILQNFCLRTNKNKIKIKADQFAFQYYSSGILNGTCGTNIDHAVLVVGYGTLNGQDYWKVKNSWGTSWGEQGYVLICRNCDENGGAGECGINLYPAYPDFGVGR